MPQHALIAPRAAPAPARRAWSWRRQETRAWVYQAIALAGVLGLAGLLLVQTLANMRARGIQSGFDFLLQPAGFDIGEGWLAYDSGQSYWQALLAGLLNTLRVALAGIVLTTLLGGLLGLGRFSRNALVRGLCYSYVELFRNIPVLLQLLMWYLLFTEYLPDIEHALRLGQWLVVSKNGLSYPVPVWGAAGLAWDLPRLTETQVEGGGALSPEYLAVLLGLMLYTAAFVAEVVRGGIASVARGQHEAGAALGLSRAQSMRLVVLPQAMRVIIPPLTNQYLNLTKNSSLAVAVGYPDLVSIANTSINQTGRAVECITVVMLVYLGCSLLTSGLMQALNRRAALRER